MIKLLQVILGTSFIFVILLIYTRILGKKQLSQLTYFNYITGITIGSMSANVMMRYVKSFFQGFIVITIWFLLTLLTGMITLKSIYFKKMIDGNPTVVIQNGKLKKRALRKLRLNINDLSMLLRLNNIFSLKDVDYAIFETNGRLSIVKDINKQIVTKEDMKIVVATPKYVPTIVITDGRLNEENIESVGLTKEWVIDQLQQNGFHSLKDITYVEVQTDGKLFIDYK